MSKRVFWIVLDSAGIGGAPDAADFGDSGADTFGTCYKSGGLDVPNMEKMCLYNIAGTSFCDPKDEVDGCYCRMHEKSRGKDTTVGHWEMAGMVSPKPLPTYYEGFPQEILDKLSEATGRKIVCNKTYSGTDVIRAFFTFSLRTCCLDAPKQMPQSSAAAKICLVGIRIFPSTCTNNTLDGSQRIRNITVRNPISNTGRLITAEIFQYKPDFSKVRTLQPHCSLAVTTLE
jgi:phosphopentomutase